MSIPGVSQALALVRFVVIGVPSRVARCAWSVVWDYLCWPARSLGSKVVTWWNPPKPETVEVKKPDAMALAQELEQKIGEGGLPEDKKNLVEVVYRIYRTLKPKQPKPTPTEPPSEDVIFYDVTEIPEEEFYGSARASTPTAPTTTTTPIVVEKPPTPLETWKNALPGYNLQCTLPRENGEEKISFTDYLLQNVLLIENVQDVSFDNEGNFTLTYPEASHITISKLPQDFWDAFWKDSKALYYTIIGLLALSPAGIISHSVQGRIFKTTYGTTVKFTGDSLYNYSEVNHLDSITVLDGSRKDGRTLVVDVTHCLPGIPQIKNLVVDHNTLIRVLDLNLYPEYYT